MKNFNILGVNWKIQLLGGWRGEWEKFGDVLAEKKVTLSWLMNSNMVKHEKFDYLHLVDHFTVPLIIDKFFIKPLLFNFFLVKTCVLIDH